MTFLAAGWLMLLLPWLALGAWFWRRDVIPAAISARFLWPDLNAVRSHSRTRRRPPIAILIALVALLCGILALAEPGVRIDSPRLTVLVDTHVSSTARISSGRFQTFALDQLRADLALLQADPEITFVHVTHGDEKGKIETIHDAPPTARSTRAQLEMQAAWHGARGECVVVLSAQALDLPDTVLSYGPVGLSENVAITGFAANERADHQAMVTITHPPSQSPFDVIIRSDRSMRSQEIRPAADQTRTTAFIELPQTTSDWLEASIDVDDGFSADDRAYLAREGGWPRIEVVGDVPPAAERLAAIFSRLRPPNDRSTPVRFTDRAFDGPAIWFEPSAIDIGEQRVALSSPDAMSNAIFHARVTRVAKEVPAGFDVVSRAGTRPIVAVRRMSFRQAWVGFDVKAFSSTADFVGWMNALIDWVNFGGPPRWTSRSVDTLDNSSEPVTSPAPARDDPKSRYAAGLYRAPNGEIVAANLPPVEWATPDSTPARSPEMLDQMLRRARHNQTRPLAGNAIVFGLGLTILGGILMASRWRLDVKGGST